MERKRLGAPNSDLIAFVYLVRVNIAAFDPLTTTQFPAHRQNQRSSFSAMQIKLFFIATNNGKRVKGTMPNISSFKLDSVGRNFLAQSYAHCCLRSIAFRSDSFALFFSSFRSVSFQPLVRCLVMPV